MKPWRLIIIYQNRNLPAPYIIHSNLHRHIIWQSIFNSCDGIKWIRIYIHKTVFIRQQCFFQQQRGSIAVMSLLWAISSTFTTLINSCISIAYSSAIQNCSTITYSIAVTTKFSITTYIIFNRATPIIPNCAFIIITVLIIHTATQTI